MAAEQKPSPGIKIPKVPGSYWPKLGTLPRQGDSVVLVEVVPNQGGVVLARRALVWGVSEIKTERSLESMQEVRPNLDLVALGDPEAQEAHLTNVPYWCPGPMLRHAPRVPSGRSWTFPEEWELREALCREYATPVDAMRVLAFLDQAVAHYLRLEEQHQDLVRQMRSEKESFSDTRGKLSKEIGGHLGFKETKVMSGVAPMDVPLDDWRTKRA